MEVEESGGSPRALAAGRLFESLSAAVEELGSGGGEAVDLGYLHGRFRDTLVSARLVIGVSPTAFFLRGDVVCRGGALSLPALFYADGARRFTLKAHGTRAEFLRFVELLAVRRAAAWSPEIALPDSLRGSTIIAIEAAPIAVRPPPRPLLVDTWDLPLPAHSGHVPVLYQDVHPSELVALRNDAAEAPASVAVRTVGRLLEDERIDLPFVEALPHIVGPIHQFLSTKGDWRAIVSLARVLGRNATPEIWSFFTNDAALDVLFGQVAEEGGDAPSELHELFRLVPGDHLNTLIRCLGRSELDRESRDGGEEGQSRRDAHRRVVMQLLERLASSRLDVIVAAARREVGVVARDLLGVAVRAAPARRIHTALALTDHPDVEVRLAVLRILEAAPTDGGVSNAVLAMMRWPEEEVHVLVMEVLIHRRDASVFPGILQHLEDKVGSLAPAEADAIGRALATLSPAQAEPIFTRWIQPSSLSWLWGSKIAPMRLWAAASGLALLPGDHVERLLKKVGNGRGAEELRLHVATLLARRAGA